MILSYFLSIIRSMNVITTRSLKFSSKTYVHANTHDSLSYKSYRSNKDPYYKFIIVRLDLIYRLLLVLRYRLDKSAIHDRMITTYIYLFTV